MSDHKTRVSYADYYVKHSTGRQEKNYSAQRIDSTSAEKAWMNTLAGRNKRFRYIVGIERRGIVHKSSRCEMNAWNYMSSLMRVFHSSLTNCPAQFHFMEISDARVKFEVMENLSSRSNNVRKWKFMHKFRCINETVWPLLRSQR